MLGIIETICIACLIIILICLTLFVVGFIIIGIIDIINTFRE